MAKPLLFFHPDSSDETIPWYWPFLNMTDTQTHVDDGCGSNICGRGTLL